MAVDDGPRAYVRDLAPAGWDELVAGDADATPAHRSEVVRALAAVLPGMSGRYVAVEREGVLIGGAPVCFERRAGMTWLHALPFLLSGAPIARPGERDLVDRAVAEALAALAAEHRVLGGEWSCYRPSCALPDAVLERVAGETRHLSAAVIDVVPGGRLERGLDRDDRYKLRHARAAGFTLREEPEALDRVYALHRAQSRWWVGHRPLPLELSRRLLADRSGREPAALLFTAHDARGLAAGTLVLDHPRETFLWWSGSRPASSASRFLLTEVAEWAAARGRARVNLGASSGRASLAAFKRSLGAREVRYPVRWLAPAAGHAGTRAVAALQAWVRRGRHRGA
jgi:GNAT acetyltransferase-like protein